jgi:trimeric autotransporter adhesin
MSTKTLRKRIALVAVSAMGFGLLSVAPSSAADVTGTVSAVRYSETAGARDLTPYAAITWTASANTLNTATATMTLTSAPTASAVAELAVLSSVGAATNNTWDATAAGSDSLADTGTALTLAAITAGSTSLAITVSAPGRYIGTIAINTAVPALVDTVSFDFTTVGAPASYSVTSSAATSNPSGTTTHVVKLMDANGATTQPGAFDTIALTDGTSTGSFAAADVSISASEIHTGSYTATYTAPSTAATASTLTFTPQGVLVGLGVKTATVTTDSVVIDATAVPAQGAAPAANANNTSFAVTSPTGVTDADTGGDVDNNDITAAIPTGTSSVTVTVLMAANATTYRFKGVASAGTLNGGTTATAFVNATTPATGTKTATVTFTLAGNATAAGATLTITQVDVVNTAVAGLEAVLTQTAPALNAASITQSPSGSIVRQLGTSTPITVTVKNNYGTSLGAGYVVNLFRGASVAGGTLISTATTGADSTAVVSAVNLSTVVSGGSEQYSVQVVPSVGSAVADDAIATIVYTTTGGITSLSTAISGTTGATTPVTDTTLASAVTIYPAVIVPTDGTANDVDGDQIYTVSTAAVTGTAGATAEAITLASNATADNTSTYTATTAGAFVSSTASTAWNAGLSTVTVAEGASVYVFATTVGLHTITVTSGDKTSTIRFWAYNLATDYYSISAVADASTLKPSSNTVVTVTVKDIFGNVVDAADGLLTATASAKVRLAGQALSQSLNTTAAGTSSFTIIGDATAGEGTITIAPTATGAQAWATAYVAPTGAAAPVKSTTVTITVEGAPAKSAELLAIEAIAAKAAADKAESDAKIAALEAQIAANKATTDAAIAAAQAAAVAASEAAADAAAEAIDAGNNAFDAATSAGEAADAATAAAEQAGEDATAAANAAGEAAVAAAEAAQEAAAEATDAANAATDAANASAEAADAATAAAQDAADAVAALSTQVSEMVSALKKQITALTNLVIKIQKKVRA